MKYINTIMDEEMVLEEVRNFLENTLPCWTGYEESEAGSLFEIFQDEILKDPYTTIHAINSVVMPESGIIAYNGEFNMLIKYELQTTINGSGNFTEAISVCQNNCAYAWRPVIKFEGSGEKRKYEVYPDLIALEDDMMEDSIINKIIDAYQRF